MEELKQRVCDVVSYNKNIGVVQTKIQVLTEMVAQVQSLRISGENGGRDDVQQWLAEAGEILIRANGILEGSNSMAVKKRLCSTCWDPTSSWEIGDILRGIDRIFKEREDLDLPSLAYCMNLQSRENMLGEILEALMDIHINMIGIYGMFGVGKTVLAKELARRAQNNQLFDAIVMVQVSESVDVKVIQTQIANNIGLQLSEADDEETRAQFLCNKLDEKVIESRQEINIEPIQYSKILVILDGIQRAVDLRKVGILNEREGKSRCKVVVISRNSDVCIEMDAEMNFLVECLSLEEAKILFRERLRDKIESMDVTLESERYQYVENVMLMKCGGLSLMINSLVCALMSMSWSNWEILADKMERHTLLEVDEVQEVPCAILELCNNFIQTGRKQKLFLLCCLIILEGEDVPLQKLMRYGIGFGLFDVGSFDSAVGQLNSWVLELKSLSLLMESEKPQHVKMHFLIQDIVISALSQGDYVLPVLLDAGNCWHTRESYENCIAISMTNASNYKFLSDLDLHKLEAFLLKGRSSLSLPNHLFQGMQNLKILDISGITFVDFPSSIGDLKNLVTLHLEHCDIKCGVLSTISNLAKLEVLSLRDSRVETVPEEIGNLTNLRVLHLTRCKDIRTFCVDAVAKLDQLRGLYLYDIYWDWSTNDVKKLKSLPLEVLEIVIPKACQISLNVLNLRSFMILCMGRFSKTPEKDFSYFSRVLIINGEVSYHFQESGLRDLLPWTECLQIKEVSDLWNDLSDLSIHGFMHLRNMYVERCDGMKCIFDASKQSLIQRDIFPELEIMNLTKLSSLTSICHSQARHSSFSKLRELRLRDLNQLHPYVLPLQVLVKLRVMEVINCRSLRYIFPISEIKPKPNDQA